MTSDMELERTRRALVDANRAAVSSGLAAANAKLADAKRALADALTAADEAYDITERRKHRERAAEAHEQIADAALEVRGLTYQKDQVELAARQPMDDGARFERAISRLPKPAQDWCRRHPDYVTDQRKNAAANAAHEAALDEGLAEHSAEYFDYVEARLGLSGGRERERRRREPVLSEREREAAKISFPDEWRENPDRAVNLYLKNKRALEREGRMDQSGPVV